MTPPDVNLKKQRRRHWPVFWGIAGASALAFLAWIAVSGYLDEPEEPVMGEETSIPAADDNALETDDTD